MNPTEVLKVIEQFSHLSELAAHTSKENEIVTGSVSHIESLKIEQDLLKVKSDLCKIYYTLESNKLLKEFEEEIREKQKYKIKGGN